MNDKMIILFVIKILCLLWLVWQLSTNQKQYKADLFKLLTCRRSITGFARPRPFKDFPSIFLIQRSLVIATTHKSSIESIKGLFIHVHK